MNLPPPAEGWPAADKAAEALFSRFQIDTSRKFGEGGYGATYAAIDNAATGAARNCAAKVVNLSKMKLESLQDECRVLDNLGKDGGHPNVIKLLGHGRGRRSAKQEGQYFIFMEAASGGELFDVVIDRGAKAMTEEEARGFFIGVLSGLMHCHSRGIVHRDMKARRAERDQTGSRDQTGRRAQRGQTGRRAQRDQTGRRARRDQTGRESTTRTWESEGVRGTVTANLWAANARPRLAKGEREYEQPPPRPTPLSSAHIPFPAVEPLSLLSAQPAEVASSDPAATACTADHL